MAGSHSSLQEPIAAEARHSRCTTWTLDHSDSHSQGEEGQLVVRIEASTEHPDDVAAVALLVHLQLAAALVK